MNGLENGIANLIKLAQQPIENSQQVQQDQTATDPNQMAQQQAMAPQLSPQELMQQYLQQIIEAANGLIQIVSQNPNIAAQQSVAPPVAPQAVVPQQQPVPQQAQVGNSVPMQPTG